MKKPLFLVSLALTLAGFAALVAAPAAAAEGVRHGLSVCAGVIIPSLLPFLILSSLLTALELPRLLAKAAGPLMGRLFAVPGAAAAPLLLGLTGGYPVGAAATAELVRRGELSPEEGGRVLAFCNNTGPAFILGAAGSGVFGSARFGMLLYLSHILAAVAVGVLLRFSAKKKDRTFHAARRSETPPAFRSLPEALPECVKGAVDSLLNICGFVTLFSAVTALLDARGWFSGAAGFLAARTGAELRFVRALLTGILELGGGIGVMSGLSPAPQNLALASFLLGFGGLSVHCQTLSVVAGAELGTARHFLGRLLHGALSAGITFLLCILGQ